MLSLISAEMLKVRKRRATWIMFAIFLTFIAVMVVGIRPIVLGEEGRDSVEFQALNEAIRFPMGFAVVLLFVSQMGRWNLIVFAALVVGSEYGWGTVRQVMARGASRNRYLAAKLVAIALSALLAMLMTLVIGSALMILGDLLVDGWGPTLPAGFFVDLAVDTLRTLGVLIAFGMVSFCIALLTRSAAGGLGLGLGYLFVEAILVPMFGFFGGFWGDLADFLLTSLADSVMSGNSLGVGEFFTDGASGAGEGLGGGMDPAAPGLYLLLYGVVLLTISVWVFNRRDITGAG